MEHARNPLVCRRLKARLAMVKRHTQAVDRELNRLVARDAELSHRVELLRTMPGVADVTSVGLAVDVPELGTLSVRTAGSLAGLAPVANDSGSRRGKRRIQGGRASVRTLLYMSAMNAVQNNPVMRERHNRRKARGMVPKVSLTTEMRKLIVMANAIIRDDTPWSLEHVPKAPAA